MKIVKQLTGDFFTLVFTIFCLVFPLGQLQRIQLPGNYAFYLHELVLTVFVLGFIWQQRKISLNKEKILNFLKKFKLEVFLLGWIILGMTIGLVADRIDLKSFLYFARLVDYSLFVFALQKIRLKYAPAYGFLFSGTLIGLWGLLQYWLMPDVKFLNIFGWDNHYYRLISSIFDPAFTGMILVLTNGLWQRVSKHRLAILCQILLTIAVAATFSRASYLALFLLIGQQWFTTSQKIKWSLISLVFLTTILVLPKPGGEGVNLARTSTIEARSENIQENLITLEKTQWAWGRGLFNNDAQKTSYTNNHAQLPDNLIVLVINSTGVVGLISLIILTKKWLKTAYQQDKLWSWLVVTVLVHSLFNNTLLQPFVFLSLFGSKKLVSKLNS